MNEIKNVLIIGLGAIGSIYATKLYDYNPTCVKVLLDKDRYKKYSENGIIFNNRRFNFDYILDTQTNFKADLILIATKSVDFEKASDMIKNFVSQDTIIMSLLNGISSEEILFKKYRREKVLYSYFIGHASMKSGWKINFDGVGTLVFGEENNQQYSQKVQIVKNFFDKVGINYQIPEDMLSALWQKFVINIGANQTLTIVDSPYEAFRTSEYVRNTAYELMREAVKIAEAIGINYTETFIDKAFELFCNIPTGLKPSMLQDIENKKTTEIDIFAGEICRLGKKYNISTPKNELVFDIIKAIDERNIKKTSICLQNNQV